jgi:hypothetical protein
MGVGGLTRLTQQQFDSLTVEELDAFLERRDAEERRRALLAANVGKEIFLRFAAELVRQERSLIFNIPSLAEKVAVKCRELGVVNPRGDKPYSAKTTYNYLAENRLKLLDALAGETPGSVDALLLSALEEDHGAGKVSR